MTFPDPPPWAFEVCSSCSREVLLELHDLSCPWVDPRPRAAVAWICNDCDVVLRTIGLFTDWKTALYARQAELDLRCARYFAEHPVHEGAPVTNESRRRGPE
jgi:hypothetical protein